ncbi:hypothetical protein HGM15179_019360, partial [Zosterops borbonicus]
TPIEQAFLLPRNYPEQVPSNPLIIWTQIVGSNKPIVTCSLFSKGEKINHLGMIDTGANVTIIACSEWPSDWELEPVAGMISGIGGVTVSMRNKRNVTIGGPEGKMATITPFVVRTIRAIEEAGFEIREDKIQYTCPWTYLGLRIHKQTIVPQQLTIWDDLKTLWDLYQLCGNEDLDSPRTITLEAWEAIVKVQEALSSHQAHRFEHSLSFQLTILGENAKFTIRHFLLAFATLGVPEQVKTDNDPAYAS